MAYLRNGANLMSLEQQLLASYHAPAGGNSASFIGYDYATHGNWIGTYGSLGHAIPSGFIQETTTGTYWSLPSGVTATFSGNFNYEWEGSVIANGTPYTATDFDSAMEYPGASPTDPRIASTWYNDWTCQLTLSSTKTVSFYFLDWDTTTRSVTFSVFDADTNTLLDSKTIPAQNSFRPLNGYYTGMYLRYTLSGNIKLTLTFVAGNNSVMSAMFFD